jgi:EAL and modified HD-GYP domain-containing signal transduction protein
MDNKDNARLAIKQMAGSRISVLASRVNNEQDLALAHELNATFLQGRFYKIRKQLASKKHSVTMQTIVELIAELNSDGPDMRLEKFYKENPELSLQLFHMVNSAGSGLSISTIRQAIFILGRSQMIRWLQTILYTLDGNVRPSALMQSALWRAKFMEVLSAYYKHKVSHTLEDMAFITGIISLADVLLGEPMEEVVSKMKLSDTIQEALLHHKGPLGSMLLLTEALEVGDFVMAEQSANALEFSSDLIMTCQNTAWAWSTKISCHQDT